MALIDERDEVGAGVKFADVAGLEFYFGRPASSIAVATVNDHTIERRDRLAQTACLDVGDEVIELLPLEKPERFPQGGEIAGLSLC